jgi:hypothetical protein
LSARFGWHEARHRHIAKELAEEWTTKNQPNPVQGCGACEKDAKEKATAELEKWVDDQLAALQEENRPR